MLTYLLTRERCASGRQPGSGIRRALFAATLLALLPAGAVAAPPNIVFILADDLGMSDLGVYGQKLAETPHLDRLAQQGMRFTQAYAPAPICSASRAALLTGRTPARLHFEFVTKDPKAEHPAGTALQEPPFPVDLSLAEVTLAEVLGPAGYASGFFGKWHLTQANDRYLGHGETFGPRQQGFDTASETRGSHPYSYLPEGSKGVPPFGALAPGEFAPDALTDEAVDFLRSNRDRRFLLYLSHYYVHAPVHTRSEWLFKKYRAKAARLDLPVSDGQIRYAAMIETMDHLVGRVLTALDELGLTENTLVVFTSDNGGHPHYVAGDPLRGGKWTLYEGGVRVPLLVRWPGRTAAGAVSETPVTGTDFFPTFCEAAGATPAGDRSRDGLSLVPLLAGRSRTLARDTLTWHFPYYHPWVVGTKPVSAIRRGGLKLLYFYEDRRAELYDLRADPGEQRDQAAARPQEAAELLAQLQAELTAQGARLPQPVAR